MSCNITCFPMCSIEEIGEPFGKYGPKKKSLAKIKEKRFPGISLPFLYTFFEAAFQYLNPIFGGGSTLGNEVTSQLSCIQMYKTRV